MDILALRTEFIPFYLNYIQDETTHVLPASQVAQSPRRKQPIKKKSSVASVKSSTPKQALFHSYQSSCSPASDYSSFEPSPSPKNVSRHRYSRDNSLQSPSPRLGRRSANSSFNSTVSPFLASTPPAPPNITDLDDFPPMGSPSPLKRFVTVSAGRQK